jgi:hypothetical protein
MIILSGKHCFLVILTANSQLCPRKNHWRPIIIQESQVRLRISVEGQEMLCWTGSNNERIPIGISTGLTMVVLLLSGSAVYYPGSESIIFLECTTFQGKIH